MNGILSIGYALAVIAAPAATLAAPISPLQSPAVVSELGALRALPTKQPPVTDSGLTIIPLSINGQACGVLGSAGAVGNAIAACGRSPINVSGIVDWLP
jgi:hypothetical protein